MSVTFKKKGKEVFKKKSKEVGSEGYSKEEAVDEYVALQSEIATIQEKLTPLVGRQAKMKVQLLEYGEDYEKGDKVILDGLDHRVELSANGNSTKITADNEELVDVLGQESFFALAKFGVTELRKALTKKELDTISVTERTSARRVKIII